MSDPWAELTPSVVTSAITTVLTLALTAIVRGVADVRAAQRVPLRLRRGALNTWRLRNELRRTVHAVEYGVLAESGEWRLVNSDLMGGRMSLGRGEELYIEGLAPGYSLLVAWTTRRLGRKDIIKTSEVRIREGVEEYDLREGTLTYGWGFGPH